MRKQTFAVFLYDEKFVFGANCEVCVMGITVIKQRVGYGSSEGKAVENSTTDQIV